MIDAVTNTILGVISIALTATVLWLLADAATADAWTPGWWQCAAIIVCARAVLSDPDTIGSDR